ncbi:unnamed protein product, partial [Laminaria digitata]
GGGSGAEELWWSRVRKRTPDADQQLALGEECLLLLILLATEMPVIPDPLPRNVNAPGNSVDVGVGGTGMGVGYGVGDTKVGASAGIGGGIGGGGDGG